MLPHITAEWTILDLLIEATEQTLTVPELVQAIGSPATTAEALDTLHAVGLIGSKRDFVFLNGEPDALR
jgi:hypothetical protein